MHFLLYLPILFLSLTAPAGTVNHKAHVHGAAKIVLALETSTQGTIDLDVPAESIYGFEHKATTKADKEAEAKGLKPLKGNPYSIIRLPSDCEIKVIKVEMEKAEDDKHEEVKGDEHHGEHADINASYSVKCVKPISGIKAWIGMFDIFPRLKTVSFQVLTSSGQTETKVQSSHEFITLP